MPIFEYRCNECGTLTEFLLKSSASNDKPVCSKCGSDKLRKLISVPNISVENSRKAGATCCGATERCEIPPCSDGSCVRG